MTRVLTGSMMRTLQSAAPAAPILPSISTCVTQEQPLCCCFGGSRRKVKHTRSLFFIRRLKSPVSITAISVGSKTTTGHSHTWAGCASQEVVLDGFGVNCDCEDWQQANPAATALRWQQQMYRGYSGIEREHLLRDVIELDCLKLTYINRIRTGGEWRVERGE